MRRAVVVVDILYRLSIAFACAVDEKHAVQETAGFPRNRSLGIVGFA